MKHQYAINIISDKLEIEKSFLDELLKIKNRYSRALEDTESVDINIPNCENRIESLTEAIELLKQENGRETT